MALKNNNLFPFNSTSQAQKTNAKVNYTDCNNQQAFHNTLRKKKKKIRMIKQAIHLAQLNNKTMLAK